MERTLTGEQAVADLYRGSYARLVGVVTLAAGGRAEAEECVQEAFVRLLGVWDKVSHYDDPEAWVRMVAFRKLSNRRRTAIRGLRALLRHGADDAVPGPSGDSLDVTAALASLPQPQCQVLVLHHMLGLSVEDVARELSIAPGTVKSRLSRGRAALEPLLREETFRA